MREECIYSILESFCQYTIIYLTIINKYVNISLRLGNRCPFTRARANMIARARSESRPNVTWGFARRTPKTGVKSPHNRPPFPHRTGGHFLLFNKYLLCQPVLDSKILPHHLMREDLLIVRFFGGRDFIFVFVLIVCLRQRRNRRAGIQCPNLFEAGGWI